MLPIGQYTITGHKPLPGKKNLTLLKSISIPIIQVKVSNPAMGGEDQIHI